MITCGAYLHDDGGNSEPFLMTKGSRTELFYGNNTFQHNVF